MFIPRVYQDIELREGANVELARMAANHLVTVLRLQVNDNFILFNGQGGEYQAHIIAIAKNAVVARIDSFIAKEVESSLPIHLGQGISRGEKMDYVIQKAIELGVKQITPLITMKCGVKLSAERWDKRLQHWRAVAIAACEQCGRNQIPEIFEPQPLSNWVEGLQADLKLVGQPSVDITLKNYNGSFRSIALLVGPESGIDEKELVFVKEKGFKPVSLGPRILRTETAAVAAISAIQTLFGDMG